MKTLGRFARDESAATAIEYCLIASLISIAVIVGVNGVGATLTATYTAISTALK
ncbi:MAG: Flp family type IVb pilin [Pseudolabrys sp.]